MLDRPIAPPWPVTNSGAPRFQHASRPAITTSRLHTAHARTTPPRNKFVIPTTSEHCTNIEQQQATVIVFTVPWVRFIGRQTRQRARSSKSKNSFRSTTSDRRTDSLLRLSRSRLHLPHLSNPQDQTGISSRETTPSEESHRNRTARRPNEGICRIRSSSPLVIIRTTCTMCMRVLWDISNGKGSLGESSSDLPRHFVCSESNFAYLIFLPTLKSIHPPSI